MLLKNKNKLFEKFFICKNNIIMILFNLLNFNNAKLFSFKLTNRWICIIKNN